MASDGLQWLFGDKKTSEQQLEEALALLEVETDGTNIRGVRPDGTPVVIDDSQLNPSLGSLKLDAGIRNRGEDLYYNGAKSNAKTQSGLALEALTSMIPTALTGAMPGAQGLQLLGNIPALGRLIPGVRDAKIKDLASDKTLVGTYDGGTNRYAGLNPIDKFIFGIGSDDITKRVIYDRGVAMENNDQYRELEQRLSPEEFAQVVPKGALSETGPMVRMADELKEASKVTDEINKLKNGPELLRQAEEAAGGKRLTSQQLQAVRAEAQKLDDKPGEQRLERGLDIQEDQVQNETNRISELSRSNRATENLTAIRDQNSNALSLAEIDYKNDKLKYDTDITNAKLRYEYDTGNFDRELKRDLALLGIEDSREERRYRSERDRAQDRQLFILQLMKGLSGLGQGFAN